MIGHASLRAMHSRFLPTIIFALASLVSAAERSPLQERADRFLLLVNASFQALGTVNNEAQWLAVTDVSPAHDAASETAGKATEDWRKILKEATGEDLSTRAMLEYYQPLMTWLQEQNKGRPIGWE